MSNAAKLTRDYDGATIWVNGALIATVVPGTANNTKLMGPGDEELASVQESMEVVARALWGPPVLVEK